MDLGKLVVDKSMLDRLGRSVGKVDDLAIELPDTEREGALPVVVGILSGPGAIARRWPRPLRALVRWLYRLLGVERPEPTFVPWDDVAAIDVVIHLAVTAEEAHLVEPERGVDARILGHLPGA